jgi:hypothetical protein
MTFKSYHMYNHIIVYNHIICIIISHVPVCVTELRGTAALGFSGCMVPGSSLSLHWDPTLTNYFSLILNLSLLQMGTITISQKIIRSQNFKCLLLFFFQFSCHYHINSFVCMMVSLSLSLGRLWMYACTHATHLHSYERPCALWYVCENMKDICTCGQQIHACILRNKTMLKYIHVHEFTHVSTQGEYIGVFMPACIHEIGAWAHIHVYVYMYAGHVLLCM